MYLLGYDIGSSSVKAALLDAGSGAVVASAVSPETELDIIAVKPGWAEQRPEVWWEHARLATARVLSTARVDSGDIKAIGISYQMHGLVIVNRKFEVLRPSIIWCDSRAVETGERAFRTIGGETCLWRCLNSPGNFTASKLKWVMDNEPDIFSQIYKAMLPGDYIAMKMTGDINITPSGLSEGIMWDYRDHGIATLILDHYRIPHELIPDIVPTFSVQGHLTRTAAEELGLKTGTLVSYRAGDQPNNALSLNVLNPGEIAATAGTSGVVYGVTDMANFDPLSRVNTFVHVNHREDNPRYGVLMCINGTGILNSWLKRQVAEPGMSYQVMNERAAEIPAGSDGIVIIPYGNGAERTLENKDLGALILGINFNTHTRAHLFRAAQEGIVFALKYGLDIMRAMNVEITTVRAGKANMFLSPLFQKAFATVTNAVVELYNTDGSQGAARGAGIGAGIYSTPRDAFVGLRCEDIIEPDRTLSPDYARAYDAWRNKLEHELKGR